MKVSNLEQMVQSARYDYLIVNDSDIRVESDYLQRVISPLADPHVGMVTCLYRGIAEMTVGSKLEALGIADFCSSVLVAEQVERGLHFGLGSTLAFRRSELNRIGGFKSIVDFLADDYELGRRIAALGLTIVLSDVVVETHLPAYDLRDFVMHQLRWARGVRDARRGGYIGLVLDLRHCVGVTRGARSRCLPVVMAGACRNVTAAQHSGPGCMQKCFARRGSG